MAEPAATTDVPAAGSKSQQAYGAVKQRIVDGVYPPGHRLVLAAIAQDLGVSVVPVREAIRRLEAEGLVTFQRNVGATVAGIDPTEYLYTMQTLSLVEGAATALSARRPRRAALTSLSRLSFQRFGSLRTSPSETSEPSGRRMAVPVTDSGSFMSLASRARAPHGSASGTP